MSKYQKSSNLFPPKKVIPKRIIKNNANQPREEIKSNTKNDLSLNTKVNDDNYNISFNEKNSFEDFYDDDENNFYNNYIKSKEKYITNNYLAYKRKEILKNIKKALNPFKGEDENNFDYDNPFRKGRRKSQLSESGSIAKNRLNRYLAKGDFDFKIKIHRFNTFPNNKSFNMKNDSHSKYSKFFDEESAFIPNEKFFQPSSSNSNKNERSNIFEENKESNILRLNKNRNKRKKSDDLISESKNNSYDENNNKRKKNFGKDKINLKTEFNNDRFKEKIKKNYLSSVNSENRRLKTSLIDANHSRTKFFKKGIFESNNNNSNNYLLSSNDSVINIINPITKENNFCIFYFNYFVQREIFLTSFYNKKEDVPSFIRIPTFLLVMTFIFTINCLFLTTSFIHNRYTYAKKNKEINEMKYVFTKEIGKSFYCAIIGNIFKIICIKLIYLKYFRISKNTKIDLTPFDDNITNTEKINKRENFLKKYRKKSMIYIGIVIALVFLLGFFSINYIGTFTNTKLGIFLGFFLSVIWSIMFCAIICLIIVTFKFIGEKFNIHFFNISYKWMKIIY